MLLKGQRKYIIFTSRGYRLSILPIMNEGCLLSREFAVEHYSLKIHGKISCHETGPFVEQGVVWVIVSQRLDEGVVVAGG